MIKDTVLQQSKEELYKIQGYTTNIERYATHDGYGLRTTIFFKGCPLRCKWCCNPETQEFHQEMVFFKDQCIGCGECQRLCPYGALSDGLDANREICKDCYNREEAFACTRKCYPKCRKIDGDLYSVKDLYDIVKRDMEFYNSSGGGVTISGGEPLAQPNFLYALLRSLKENWIDTAIETCGIGESEDYEKIAPYLNMVFMDLKSVDKEKHIEWTGSSNEKILNNICLMNELSGKYGFKFILRTPVIPGFNDTGTEIKRIGKFIHEHCKNISGFELLPYHRLGRGKYTSLGRDYLLSDLISPTDQHMNFLKQICADCEISILKF